MHHALAVLQCGSETGAQCGFVLRFDADICDRQFDAVFLEAVRGVAKARSE